MSNLRNGPSQITYIIPMLIGFMSHVDFKKRPCCPVRFKGQGPQRPMLHVNKAPKDPCYMSIRPKKPTFHVNKAPKDPCCMSKMPMLHVSKAQKVAGTL